MKTKFNNIITILILSFLIFITKWVYSYYLFGNEDLVFKIIFDTQDRQYLPLIKNLSQLNLSQGFSDVYDNLNINPHPIYSLIFHSLLLKFFGYFGIIIYELIFIFTFFLFLFLICKKLNFSNQYANIFALMFFVIPLLAETSLISKIPYLKHTFEPFFYLRYPRPIVTHLFFIIFIYQCFIIDKKYIIDTPQPILYSLIAILSLILGSFFFIFLCAALYLFFFLILQLTNKENKINYKNIIKIFFLSLFFLTVSSPIIYQVFYGETDLIERMGMFDLNDVRRKILIYDFAKSYLNIKFLIFFIYIIIFHYFLKKYEKKVIFNNFKLFYYLLLCSIFSPLIFFSVSPKAVSVTFFSDITIFIIFLTMSISFLFYLKWLLSFIQKINFVDSYSKFILTGLVILYMTVYPSGFIQQKKTIKDGDMRKEIIKITKIINKNIENNQKNLKIFTNQLLISNWWILEDYKFLSMPDISNNPLKNEMIEDQIINVFKSLGLSADDFINFFNTNLIQTWRVNNRNQGVFLSNRKYQANSLVTFSNINNYDKKFQKLIIKSKPKLAQQVIMPNDEILRLKNKFLDYKKNKHRLPDFILIVKSEILYDYFNTKFKDPNYCKLYSSQKHILFIKKICVT